MCNANALPLPKDIGNGNLSGKSVLIKKCILILYILLLSGCGFHFHDAYDIPVALKTPYVEGASTPLREEFKRIIRPASGQFASNAEQSSIIIRIYSEKYSSRVLSLNNRGRSNDLELSLLIDFELLTAAHTTLVERQTLEIKREYFNNQTDIVAKDNEQSVIRNEIYQQAVRNIIMRARIVLETKPNIP